MGKTQPTYWGNTGQYQKDYDRLWKRLVPAEGKADTLHGELLRSISRIYYDLYNNGFGNGPFTKEWNIIRHHADEIRTGMRDHWNYTIFEDWFINGTLRGKRIVESDYPDAIVAALDDIVDGIVQYVMAQDRQNVKPVAACP